MMNEIVSGMPVLLPWVRRKGGRVPASRPKTIIEYVAPDLPARVLSGNDTQP
jgi:hypothetical protein